MVSLRGLLAWNDDLTVHQNDDLEKLALGIGRVRVARKVDFIYPDIRRRRSNSLPV
jgi:hypothetical protein